MNSKYKLGKHKMRAIDLLKTASLRDQIVYCVHP